SGWGERLDERRAYWGRGKIDGGHRDHDHEDDQTGGSVLEKVDRLEEQDADAAPSDEPEDGSQPHVGVEPIDRERDVRVHDLWDHRGPDDLQSVRSRCGDGFERPWVDPLARLRGELAEHADVVEGEADDAGGAADA